MLRFFCKMTFWFCLVVASLTARLAAAAQTGPTTGETGYFRLWVANDVVQRTDWYYTGGIRLEYAAPECGKTWLRHLLVSVGKDAVNLYGVTLVADAFTPTRIGSAEVQVGDRPYAGYLYAGLFLESRRPSRKLTLTTQMNIGIMGPAAGMQRVQQQIHDWLHSEQPQGWHNQISNNPLVDYSIQVAHTVLGTFRFLELTAQMGARAGTLYNHLELGSTLRVGKLNGDGRRQPPGRSLLSGGRYYVFVQPRGNWVGYNATLQGGPLNPRSPYTLRRDQVSRTVFKQTVGVVCLIGALRMETAQTWVSAEFRGGAAHRWNYVSLRFFF